MNIKRINTNNISPANTWCDAYIKDIVNNGLQNSYWLSNGHCASRSAGCLLEPEKGDQVLLYCNESGETFITQVLHKNEPAVARINIDGVKKLAIEQAEISLLAKNDISLTSLTNIDICAITGDLTLQVNNLISSVRETVVENARHRISKAFTYALDVTGLMRIQSEQGVVTAEKDLKIDAERISMG